MADDKLVQKILDWSTKTTKTEKQLDSVDLSDAKLSGKNLNDAILTNVDLTSADLRKTNFYKSDLRGAILKSADLREANLVDANLYAADLTEANLQGAHLSSNGTNLKYANLSSATLVKLELNGSDLTEAKLVAADLSEANLSNANLSKADLSEAKLHGTILTGADLRGTKRVYFDETYITGVRFDANAKDAWSVLRRIYTGPAMLWTTLALIAAITPYIAKLLFWVSVNRFQDFSEDIDCQLHDCYQVWQLVLGLDRGGFYWTVPSILIFYNMVRAYITYKVIPMREEEERSGFSPKLYGLTGYRHVFLIHQYIVRWIFWLALGLFLYNLCDWMTKTVGLPKPL